jgi:hypothetical protein
MQLALGKKTAARRNLNIARSWIAALETLGAKVDDLSSELALTGDLDETGG